MNSVAIGNTIAIGGAHPLALIAGPCVIEEEALTLEIAFRIKDLAGKYGIPAIFKASYEKDNRSSAGLYSGPGLREGLNILRRVRRETGLPVLSDVHRETDVDEAAGVLDVIQIPAFLSQQTSLLLRAGKTGKPVNLKKGQSISPQAMRHSVEKIRGTGNGQILLTERGTCFGYDRLVSDLCSIPIMKNIGCPVVFDATHIVRRYGAPSASPEGGSPEHVLPLACAGVAAGCDALFIETHPNPPEALCDAYSMLPLDQLGGLLERAAAISRIVRS